MQCLSQYLLSLWRLLLLLPQVFQSAILFLMASPVMAVMIFIVAALLTVLTLLFPVILFWCLAGISRLVVGVPQLNSRRTVQLFRPISLIAEFFLSWHLILCVSGWCLFGFIFLKLWFFSY